MFSPFLMKNDGEETTNLENLKKNIRKFIDIFIVEFDINN
jgi:hypothetical protein